MGKIGKSNLQRTHRNVFNKLSQRKRHMTMHCGLTLVCPKNFPDEVETIQIEGGGMQKRIRFCPLCGTELGRATEVEEVEIEWDN